MIRYSLRCDREHAFESWFRDSQAYDDQNQANLVECPTCGSRSVGKEIMAPAVVTSRRKVPASLPAAAEPPAAAPVALIDERTAKMRALMRELRDHIVKTSDDVGAAFPEQARMMHEGTIEHRAIRGEASPDDVRSLIEDGVEILPIPSVPDERN